MSIETLQDWNDRLGYCGCCPMPVCPAPVMVCQRMTLAMSLSGHFQDPAYPPGGDFDLAQWKTNRRRTTEYSCTLSVNEDTTNGSGGGSHVIGSGSLVAVHIEGYDEVWGKSGCSFFSQSLGHSYSGDGSFTVTTSYEYFCGGVWTKKKRVETTQTYTHVGGDANPSPPPAFYAPDTWRRDLRNETFFYVCDAGALLDNGSSVQNTADFWSYPFVVGTAAAGVHPARVITQTYTYGEPVTWADFEAEMLAWIAENKAAGCWETGTCKAVKTSLPPTAYITTGSPNIVTYPLRFRFRIPHTHLGSKFFITYDIAEVPTSGEPSFVSQDNLVEWTGPGSGLSTDPSWLTPWVEIDPPEVPGERRVVNIRYTCYSGTRFGAKPQVMGEAFTAPGP